MKPRFLSHVRLLWHMHPAQALGEAWLVGMLILFALSRLVGRVAPAVLANGVFFLCGVCGMWAVLRARVPTGPAWRQILWEVGVGMALSLVMVIGLWLPARLLGWDEAWRASTLGVVGATLLLAAIGPGYLVARVGVRFWFAWDRMRRRRMIWSLTHAHLTVALVAFLSVALVGFISLLAQPAADAPSDLAVSLAERLLHTFFPAAGAATFAFIAMLMIVLPPSALISFLIARKTTHRVERLASAASALRQGRYEARVQVTGEDEVAQLQADFNAMAETLERTLHDLQTQRDAVAQLLGARRELVANVSHELRTPVATVRAMLEVLLERGQDVPAPPVRHDLETIAGEIGRLQALIDDLFLLSQAEVEHLALECRTVEVAPLVQRIVDAMAPLAWQSGRVQVTTELPDGLPAARADETRLEQVLANLLHNGIRHTPPGGIVAVMAATEEAFVRIEVRDTGTGIAPEDLPHIWERFYRGKIAGSTEHGAGLGLALVKELTEAMAGSVSVASRVGEGSCFTVRLPRESGVHPIHF